MVSMMVVSASRRAACGISPTSNASIQAARVSETVGEVLSAAMTDPSTAELTEAGEVGLAGEALAEDEQRLGPLPGPPAVGRVGEELVDDLLIAQRLVHAAAHVRLAQLDDRAVLQRHPDVAAVVARILVVGIDDVGDLARQREDARIARLLIAELRQARVAVVETDRKSTRLNSSH